MIRALVVLALFTPALTDAEAATTCTTRKSGSVTITSCSSSKARVQPGGFRNAARTRAAAS
jgi:hypothetical protein